MYMYVVLVCKAPLYIELGRAREGANSIINHVSISVHKSHFAMLLSLDCLQGDVFLYLMRMCVGKMDEANNTHTDINWRHCFLLQAERAYLWPPLCLLQLRHVSPSLNTIRACVTPKRGLQTTYTQSHRSEFGTRATHHRREGEGGRDNGSTTESKAT